MSEGKAPTAEVLVILAEGFEEIEAITVIDVLRRAGLAVSVAALAGTAVQGSHEIRVVADTSLTTELGKAFDAVVLPGGMPGAKNLREDPHVIELVQRHAKAGKLVAAICAGPTVLEHAGLLSGRRATSFPEHPLPSARYSEERVVEDGNLITSRGPGTAIDFALTLVTRLAGPEIAATHRKRLLA